MKQIANYLEISPKELKKLLKIALLAVLAFSVKPIASVIGFGLTLLLSLAVGFGIIIIGEKD